MVTMPEEVVSDASEVDELLDATRVVDETSDDEDGAADISGVVVAAVVKADEVELLAVDVLVDEDDDVDVSSKVEVDVDVVVQDAAGVEVAAAQAPGLVGLCMRMNSDPSIQSRSPSAASSASQHSLFRCSQ